VHGFSAAFSTAPGTGHVALATAFWRVYTHFVIVTPAKPLVAGRGAPLSPKLLRSACERPIPAGGGVEGHGCITFISGGDLHPRGGLPWISFLFAFFLYLL
jgi:hypothetical protein